MQPALPPKIYPNSNQYFGGTKTRYLAGILSMLQNLLQFFTLTVPTAHLITKGNCTFSVRACRRGTCDSNLSVCSLSKTYLYTKALLRASSTVFSFLIFIYFLPFTLFNVFFIVYVLFLFVIRIIYWFEKCYRNKMSYL